jgi:hypothetical protein
MRQVRQAYNAYPVNSNYASASNTAGLNQMMSTTNNIDLDTKILLASIACGFVTLFDLQAKLLPAGASFSVRIKRDYNL